MRFIYTLYVHFYLYVLLTRPILIRITYTLYLYILLIRYTYTSNLHVILTCSTYNIMCIPTLLSLHFFRPISQKNFFLKIFSKFSQNNSLNFSQNILFPRNFPKIFSLNFLTLRRLQKISPKKKSRISPTLTYNYTLFNQQPLPIIKFS